MNAQSFWLVGIFCSIGMASAHAGTQDPWIVRAGYANVAFSPSATLTLAGNSVPGAEVRIPDKLLPLMELGYEFVDGWAARIALAQPPTVTVYADGFLKAFTPPLSGTIGKARIALIVMTVTYSPGSFIGIRAYVGAGDNYTMVMNTSDGDVASMSARNAWGSAFEIGADWSIDRNWSVYVDSRKVYVKTTGTGVAPELGGVPVQEEVALNPLIISSGIGYRF
ncbi:MAG: OmpW family protein [Dechloromonas sp.]|nr:OmpW family protein [Dechloromonas sp.]